jgi:Uma2 family endonuclease
MSEREFLAHYADERPSYEFVNGEVTQKPMTKRSHVVLQEELQVALRAYRKGRPGSFSGADPTTDFSRPADRRYFVPDVAYWAPGKLQGGEVFLPPTLAIEIQSQGQTLFTLRTKCREYRARGVDVAWLVLPSRRVVEVFDSANDGTPIGPGEKLTAAELPGFVVMLDELFAALD